MIEWIGTGYGENRRELKRDVAEAVRSAIRGPVGPEDFYDVTYQVDRTPGDMVKAGKGPWRVVIRVYALHKPDRRLPLVSLLQRLHRWKYRLAVGHDFLNIWDRLVIYGLKPHVDSHKTLGEITRGSTTTPK